MIQITLNWKSHITVHITVYNAAMMQEKSGLIPCHATILEKIFP